MFNHLCLIISVYFIFINIGHCSIEAQPSIYINQEPSFDSAVNISAMIGGQACQIDAAWHLYSSQ